MNAIRLFICVHLFLSVANCLFASPPLVADAFADKGDVRIGPPLVHTFTLRNTQAETVHVSNVTTTCGCLAPKLDRRELPPGGIATLKLEINTLSQPPGPIAWTVRLTTRAGQREEELTLRLTARLIAEIQVEPAALAFAVREPRSSVVTVRDLRSKPFRVTGAGASSPLLQVKFDAASGQLAVTGRPDGPAGTFNEAVWVTTDDPLYPQIKIPVTLTVSSPQKVTAGPASLELRAPNPGLVQLRDADSRPVVIDKIETEGPLTARGAAGPGERATVRVAVDKSKWDGQPVRGVVKVHTLGEVVAIPVDVR